MLIDEASMINSFLFSRLLSKISKKAIIVIVGDDAQLPPIGAGNILSDSLTLEIAPTVKLTKIYRQSEDQAIALIANQIREAQVPAYRNEYDDFIFIDKTIPNYYGAKNSMSQNELSDLREQNTQNIIAEIAHQVVESIEKARYRLKHKQDRKSVV